MVIVGDVGGTKIMMATATMASAHIQLQSIKRYEARDYRRFDDIVADYLSHISDNGSRELCVGVAGPIKGNRTIMTNLDWTIDGSALAGTFGFERAVIINDLVASGNGLGYVPGDSLAAIHEGKAVGGGNRVLVSPGTGLGESILLHHDSHYLPVASEGGHVDFAPFDGRSGRLWHFVMSERGRVSVEDVLSGPGLYTIFKFITLESGRTISDELQDELRVNPGLVITNHALEGTDPDAVASAGLFLDILAAEAGNMALKGLALGGVYLGGGIIPRLMPLVDRQRFLHIFSNKGKHADLLAGVPIWAVMDTNLPLYGSAGFLLAP